MYSVLHSLLKSVRHFSFPIQSFELIINAILQNVVIVSGFDLLQITKISLTFVELKPNFRNIIPSKIFYFI